MATEVAKRLINVDEYYKMAEVGILKPGDRVELINGEIYERSPIGSKHAAIVDRLARIFNQILVGKATVRIQNPIRIDHNNEPESDWLCLNTSLTTIFPNILALVMYLSLKWPILRYDTIRK